MDQRLYGSRLHGVAIGLLSTGAGLAVAELVAGLDRGAESPVVSVGQEIIDIVPPGVKDWAIDTFGTADKLALVVGTVFSLAVIGSIVGILAVTGRRVAAYAVTTAVGLIGAWAVTMRPDPTFAKLLPAIAGTLASIGALWYLAPRTSPQPADGSDESDLERPVARRGFLQGAATVAGISLVAAALGRALRGRFDVDEERAQLDIPEPDDGVATAGALAPPGTDFGIDEVTPWVVPNSDFYRIDTAITVPQVPRDSWRLRVHGMVDRELELTFTDLLARPMIERYITLSCVSNEVGGDLVGNALFQGVLFKDVLDEAGVHAAATQVVSRSIDGWSCGSPTVGDHGWS